MGFGRKPKGVGAFSSAEGTQKFPRPDLDTIKAFVDQFASFVRYWKAMECPCTTPATGQPNLACQHCRGLGFIYGPQEVEERYARAMVHSRRSQKMNEAGGFLTTGYASITFKEGIVPGDGDLVQVCADREVVNDEYHVLGSKLLDGSTAETLRFRDVFCVEAVRVWIEATKTPVFLKREVDWQFDPTSRTVKFLNGQLPGSRYSVRYQARPEYILLGQTSKPLLRVSHDEDIAEPFASKKDIVYPYNCLAVRLDRAIIQRMRGAVDLTVQSTFNTPEGRGPFL